MDLWQQLPDLSRPIPQSFQINNQAQEPESIVKFTGKTVSKISHVIFYISMIGMILSFIIGMIIRFTELYFTRLGMLNPVFGKLIILFIISAMITWMLSGKDIKKELSLLLSNIQKRAISKKPTHDKTYSTRVKIFDLMQNSRKDIATITKIEYLPVDSKDILKNHLQGSYYYLDSSTRNTLKKYSPESATFSRHCMNAVLSKPRFRIQYRFNPPDDMRVADIYHTFVTATEPENHYKVGDPLPILYQIEDRFTEDVVTSMPFPVPLEDMDDDSLVASSTTFENLNAVTANKLRDKINRLFLVKWPNGLDANANQIRSLIFSLNYHDKSINQITWLYLVKCLQNQDYQKFHPYCITVLFKMAFPPKPEEPVTEIQSFLLDFLRQLNRDDESSRRIWLRYICVISQNAVKLNNTDEYSKITQELFCTCFESLSPEYVTIIFNSLTNSSVKAGFIKLCSQYHLSVIDNNLHLLIEPLINSISYTDKSYNQLILPYIEKYLVDFTNHPDYQQQLNNLLRKVYPEKLPDIHEDIHTFLMDLIHKQIAKSGFDISNPIIYQSLEHIKAFVMNFDENFVSDRHTRKELVDNLFSTISDSLNNSNNDTNTFKILKSLNHSDINHKLIVLSIRSYNPNCSTSQRQNFFNDLRLFLLRIDNARYWKDKYYPQYGNTIIRLIFDYYAHITQNASQDMIEYYLLEPLSKLYLNYSYKYRLPDLNHAPDSLIKTLAKISSRKQIKWINQTYKIDLGSFQELPQNETQFNSTNSPASIDISQQITRV